MSIGGYALAVNDSPEVGCRAEILFGIYLQKWHA